MNISALLTDQPAAPVGGAEPPAAVPQFLVLGPMEIHDGQRIRTLRAHKPRVLLALLLMRANTVVSTDTLISEIWGDRPPRTALKALRVYVSQLRQILADFSGPGSRPIIVTRDPGYRLELKPDALDQRQFERLCELGRAARDVGDLRGALRLYRDASSLWRGPALADVRSSPLLDGVALRLDEMRVSTVERRLELEIRLGGHAEVISELRALVADHPLRERSHYQLMLALSRAGRRADALKAFRELRGTFVAELGVEPSQDLQRLHQSILAADDLAVPSWESSKP
jgi:DNA-binding SARP family transcriptional activator